MPSHARGAAPTLARETASGRTAEGYSVKAASSTAGSGFPRRAALETIPALALSESQYLCSWSSACKTEDKEHSTPSLGESEMARVQHAPGEPIPRQPPEEGTKIPALVRRQDYGFYGRGIGG